MLVQSGQYCFSITAVMIENKSTFVQVIGDRDPCLIDEKARR